MQGTQQISRLQFLARGASASAASAHDISRVSTNIATMEVSMRSDTTIQSSVTSNSTVSRRSLVNQQIIDQFAQMKTMMSSFGPRQETTRTAFCKYLACEVEALEDRDFQTFINEAVNLLSGIQSRQSKGAVSLSNHSNR